MKYWPRHTQQLSHPNSGRYISHFISGCYIRRSVIFQQSNERYDFGTNERFRQKDRQVGAEDDLICLGLARTVYIHRI